MNAITQMEESRFRQDNPNMDIWLRSERTDKFVSHGSDKEAVKKYNKKGFSGSAINATYIVKRLTDLFGPIGLGWGVDVVSEEYKQGGPLFAEDKKTVLAHAVVHTLQISFWYVHPNLPDKVGRFVQFGQTDFISKDSRGIVTDEEAPKKSLTDAMTKAASWLGIASDVHLGLWDDNKYVAANAEFAEQERSAIQRALLLAKPYGFITSGGEIHTFPDSTAWVEGWIKRIKAWVTADTPEVIKRAWTANTDAVASTRRTDPDAVNEVERFMAIALGQTPSAETAPPAASGLPPKSTQEPELESPAHSSENSEGRSGEEGVTYPPEPPAAFPLVGTDKEATLHHIGKGTKGGAAEEVWLATWKRAVKGAPSIVELRWWHGLNTKHLALMRHYHPTIAVLADMAFNERAEALERGAKADRVDRSEPAAAK